MAEVCPKFSPIYDEKTEKLILNEFKRIEGKCYLDHAGTTLYSEKQIQDVLEELQNNLYSNPHSRSTPSKLTIDCLDQVRYRILEHAHTDTTEYTVVFTSGATAALKLVAECFNYAGGKFMYLQDNHTSVLGMREYAERSEAVPYKHAEELFSNCNVKTATGISNSLFAYPAQCNFSGLKYPMEWVENIQAGVLNIAEKSQWFCLVDAASYFSTNRLNLSKFKPDFVCISLYKIFGYPTGVGALLIKNSSSAVLKKKYFGGGTVYMAMSTQNTVVHRENVYERFEDGTLPFLSIIAIRHGFETLKRLNLNMELISKHTYALAKYVYDGLNILRHNNNQPACVLYHDKEFTSIKTQGGIVNFNLLRSDGSYIGFSEVMYISNLFGIQLRTGCFCNPGACQRYLGITDSDLKYHFEKGHVCGDQYDLIDGKPTGSVRISFGYMSTMKDANDFLEMVINCFITKSRIGLIQNDINKVKLQYTVFEEKEIIKDDTAKVIGKLDKIYVYPIKSCGPYPVQSSWELVATGLKFDREWMIINSSKTSLTQKNEPRMCMIRPIVDINNGKLILTSEGYKNISVPLYMESDNTSNLTCISKVCMDSIIGWDCGKEVGEWLSLVLGNEGLRLIKQSNDISSRISKKGEKQQLSLANKAQFLLINRKSAEWLQNHIPKDDFKESLDRLIDRFRPNLVVDLIAEFTENKYKTFKIDGVKFAFEGKCTRCQMICIDQHSGEKSVEPLKTISREFQGKINFGVYLRQADQIDNGSLKMNTVVTGE